MQAIAQGAEAKLFKKQDSLLKDRVKKSYRLKEIDDELRRSRTRREAKILEKLRNLKFPAPKLIHTDRQSLIEMKYIEGEKVRDILEKSDYIKLSKEIGKKIAFLHNNQIIHGDLTTSNMIRDNKTNEIFFIDFGLSIFSKRYEDKAVDLHLLKQALESKHHKIFNECFEACLNSYKKEAKESKEILKRLKEVESRGRNKAKH